MHLDDDAELYALGLLDADRGAAIEAHLAACDDCRARVVAAEAAAARSPRRCRRCRAALARRRRRARARSAARLERARGGGGAGLRGDGGGRGRRRARRVGAPGRDRYRAARDRGLALQPRHARRRARRGRQGALRARRRLVLRRRARRRARGARRAAHGTAARDAGALAAPGRRPCSCARRAASARSTSSPAAGSSRARCRPTRGLACVPAAARRSPRCSADALLDQRPARRADLEHGVRAVLHLDVPERVQLAVERLDQRDAHDRVVGHHQRRHVAREPAREGAPALAHLDQRLAACEGDARRVVAPGAVADRVVGLDLLRRRPSQVPCAISISRSSVSSARPSRSAAGARSRSCAAWGWRRRGRRSPRSSPRRARGPAACRAPSGRLAPALVAAGEVPGRLPMPGDVDAHAPLRSRPERRAPPLQRHRLAAADDAQLVGQARRVHGGDELVQARVRFQSSVWSGTTVGRVDDADRLDPARGVEGDQHAQLGGGDAGAAQVQQRDVDAGGKRTGPSRSASWTSVSPLT